MKLTWLGQAGFLLRTENRTAVMIDPYLTDSLFRKNGETHRRQVPLCGRFLREQIDVLVLTHAHGDHTDPETLDALFEVNRNIPVLAPRHVIAVLRERYAAAEEWMLFEPGTEISLNGLLFRAAFAMHSDPCPIGVVIEDRRHCICHTGDTMYHRQLLLDYPRDADLLILPINGKGNNMNAIDASRLVRALHPKAVFPMHWDMFASYGCDPQDFTRCFPEDTQRIIQSAPYQEIEI